MKQTITLSQIAIAQINEALSSGKDVQVAIRDNRLIIWEMQNKKKYEVVVTPNK